MFVATLYWKMFFRRSNPPLFSTLSWRGPLPYRNQSIDLRSKSMDWFLYDNGLRHERVKNEMGMWSYYFSNRIIILRDSRNFWFKKLFETRLLCLLFRQSSTANTGWNMCLKEKRGGNKMSQIFCFVYWLFQRIVWSAIFHVFLNLGELFGATKAQYRKI